MAKGNTDAQQTIHLFIAFGIIFYAQPNRVIVRRLKRRNLMRPLFALVAASLLSCAASMAQQTPPSAPAAPAIHPEPATIPGSVQFDYPSTATGRTYRIFVAKPMAPPPATGYPVIFLIDGDMSFGPAASRSLLGEIGADLRPAMMVGITYATSDRIEPMKLRTADLTPTPGSPEDLKNLLETKVTVYGNAERFYRFITQELRPALATIAPTDLADQTLYGHSLGGLFTLHILFTHPEAFRNFVASSPSIWWDHRAVLKNEAAFTTAVTSGRVSPRVLILAAAYEQTVPKGPLPAPYTAESLAKAIAEARMVDNARELGQRLGALKGTARYEAGFHLFEGESHTTVVPASVSRAIDFAVGTHRY